jgi:hypothetical protein
LIQARDRCFAYPIRSTLSDSIQWRSDPDKGAIGN